ncbi:glycoside hydrolase family 3 N-terminal domain-containing protein [Glutamicibacter sp.]|uniref:glycoside hydrolase family 3 protein n=1 Tax=Glutamicibacter sp. TaxID=1931995 RepID=UPI0028BD5A96|nr:glycoside hydrolase family 3 N-terminal domain-containing protein [Glutamicibacter sp.]
MDTHYDDATVRPLARRVLMPGFIGTTLPDWVAEELRAGLGSLCIYGGNIQDNQQLAALMAHVREASPQAILALDEEGGDVTRLHYRDGSNQPGNAVLGRLDDPQLTRASARAIAREMRSFGFNLNLAPDADVNTNAKNPVIGVRSFGISPHKVAMHTAAFTVGLQGEMVAACAKHFPGHGDTSTDSHLALPVVAVDPFTLAERELAPFTAAIQTGIAAIMTSHIMVPALDPQNPATFSSAILGDLLRGELGFEGVIVTDALDMAGASAETGIPVAAVRALRAGADLLCLGTDMTREDYDLVIAAITHALNDGTLDIERLRDAAARTTALAEHYRLDDEVCDPVELAVGDWSRAFETSDAVDAWSASAAPVQLVQLDTDSNMAVGRVPWGLASIAPTVKEEQIAPDAKVLLAARAMTEEHTVHALAARLRGNGQQVLVCNFGWPAPGADITTYGASPVLARTILEMLQVPSA